MFDEQQKKKKTLFDIQNLDIMLTEEEEAGTVEDVQVLCTGEGPNTLFWFQNKLDFQIHVQNLGSLNINTEMMKPYIKNIRYIC